MTLLEAIRVCAGFAHTLPGHILGEIRGQHVFGGAGGIELDAADGFNAIRVLVANDSLAPCYAHLPDRWTLTHADAHKLADVGQLTILPPDDAGDCSSETAKLGKQGRPGKSRPGPTFRRLDPDSERGKHWATRDEGLARLREQCTVQARVSRSELLATLEPLDGSAEILLALKTHTLSLSAGPWSTSLSSPDTRLASALPFQLLAAPLWNALGAMELPRVSLGWWADADEPAKPGQRASGPLLVECGDVSLLTMPTKKKHLTEAG